MIKILHTADLHLQKKGDERWATLVKILQLARAEKVDFLIIAGDLFDANSQAENLKRELRPLFSQNEFEILILPGNHDARWWQTSPFLGNNVKIFTELTQPFLYSEGKIAFYGLPFEFMSRDELLQKWQLLKAALETKRTNFLVFHGELLDAFYLPTDFGDEGRDRYLPVKLVDFSELAFDYILAGHFHTRFEVFSMKNGGYFIYPGSPISITRKELGPRRVNLFKIGQPPSEVILATPFYQEIEVFLDPTQKSSPLEVVEAALSNLPQEARVILRVKGFFDGRRHNLTEQSFQEKLEQLTAKYNVEDIQPEYYDFQRVAQERLFQEVMDRLNQRSDLEEAERTKMREIVIRAMVEALS